MLVVMRVSYTALIGLSLFLASAAIAAGPQGSRSERSVSNDRASTSLVLRLKERRLYLMHNDSRVASFPIAVGRPGEDTPTGRFEVEEMIEHPDFQKIDPSDRTRVLQWFPPGPGNPLGERWIGIAHGEGWTLGIHGTPHPELLGQAVSAGCIRMRNADVIRVYDRVELGTTVVVYP
jgi:L,D-transpeptidase ErfK/SrfK